MHPGGSEKQILGRIGFMYSVDFSIAEISAQQVSKDRQTPALQLLGKVKLLIRTLVFPRQIVFKQCERRN
jgi:hypothetical protein